MALRFPQDNEKFRGTKNYRWNLRTTAFARHLVERIKFQMGITSTNVIEVAVRHLAQEQGIWTPGDPDDPFAQSVALIQPKWNRVFRALEQADRQLPGGLRARDIVGAVQIFRAYEDSKKLPPDESH